MRPTAMFPARNILKQIYPIEGACGTLTTSTPKKMGDGNPGKTDATNEKSEPIVAFDKPPLPPFLGPLVALSLLEMASGSNDRDS